MAGVSSYAPKEIEFVLKSIVQKHKPAYIIEEFVRRFKKTLNQNQIRYIKNKYGKDPSFGPMVNYKGGNARDLKHFRRQKAQQKRQTDVEAEESTSEPEASGSQTYLASPSFNTETFQPYPNPQATLSPHGTSFLGVNTNTFGLFQPHMLLAQGVVPNATLSQLGTPGGFVSCSPLQAGKQSVYDPTFEGLGWGSPNELLGTSTGTTFRPAYTAGTVDTQALGDQQYQFPNEPLADREAIEMARLLALSTPLDLHDSLESVDTTAWSPHGSDKRATSKSPRMKFSIQSPLPTNDGARSMARNNVVEAADTSSPTTPSKKSYLRSSNDMNTVGAHHMASPARSQIVGHSWVSCRAARGPRAQSTAQQSTSRVLKARRNTDPWHRLPPGMKGMRSARLAGRYRAGAPYPSLPNFPSSLDNLGMHQDMRRAHRRQTVPEQMSRRAEKLQSRSRVVSNQSPSSSPALYNMGPPGAIEIVESPIPYDAPLAIETPTIVPTNIETSATVQSDSEQSPVLEVPSDDAPSQSTGPTAKLLSDDSSGAVPDGLPVDQAADIDEATLQAFLQRCDEDNASQANWNLNPNGYEDAVKDTGDSNGGTSRPQPQNPEVVVPLYIQSQTDTGLDYPSFNVAGFMNESLTDGNTIGHIHRHDTEGEALPDNEQRFRQGRENHETSLFLQPMPDQVADSFDNQFMLSQRNDGSNVAHPISTNNAAWLNDFSEPLDPQMFVGLSPGNLPAFDPNTTKL